MLRKASTEGGTHLDGSIPLETIGTLELRKKRSDDRVTGVLHCKAYVHLFNKARVLDTPPNRIASRPPPTLGPNRFSAKFSGGSPGTGLGARSPGGAFGPPRPPSERGAPDSTAGMDMKLRVREHVKDRIIQRNTNRNSMVASVTKCLDSLAEVQHSTDGLLSKFGRKLDEKKEEGDERSVSPTSTPSTNSTGRQSPSSPLRFKTVKKAKVASLQLSDQG